MLVRLRHAMLPSRCIHTTSRALSTARNTHHDIGGALELLDQALPSDKPMLPWELECHATFAILSSDGVLNTDSLRRAVEALPFVAHEKWGYYEKWSAAMANLLREAGHLAPGELEAHLTADDAHAAACPTPSFAAGDRVVVRTDERRQTAWRAPHLRTPGYIFGAGGVVERYVGSFADPSLLAFGVSDPGEQHLYRVRFQQADLWPEQLPTSNRDTVDVEIYESWLLPVEGGASRGEWAAPADHRANVESVLGTGHAHTSGADCGDPMPPSQNAEALDGHTPECVRAMVKQTVAHAHGPDSHSHGSHASHQHEHDTSACTDPSHDHSHASHDHSHTHASPGENEVAAIEAEGPPRPGEAVHHALVRLCVSKGLLDVERIRRVSTAIETAGVDLHGSRLVARAWVDPGFMSRLLADGNAAAAELGITASNPNAPTELCVMASDESTHHLIVCTLCSCYPAALLGPSPTWYKSRSYRARAVRKPRELLRDEFGVSVPQDVSLRVHDSTADLRYMVVPRRPEGTEGWSEERLQALVTRDGMLGCAWL
jgi:nitrile hydratase